MAIVNTAITALCISTAQGQYNDACNKALDATTRQVGLRQNVDTLENKANQIANQRAEAIVGKEAMATAGSGMWAYRVVKDRSLTFKVPTLGIADNANSRLTPSSAELTVHWKF